MMVSDGFSKPNASKISKNRGRGIAKEETIKEKKARCFFEMGIGAESTWKEPGTPGRQKCYALFKKWSLELLENYTEKINDRQIIAKQKNILSFSRLLLKLEGQLDKFLNLTNEHHTQWQEETKTAKSKGLDIPYYEPRMEWEYFIRKLIVDIAEISDHITTTEYTLTVHEQSEEELVKYLEELQERRAKYEQEYTRRIEKNNTIRK